MRGRGQGATIVIDVLGAPHESGGMNLYARELINAWHDARPDDHLVIVGNDWIKQDLSETVGTRVCVPTGTAWRVTGQFLVVAAVAWLCRADRVLSVTPLVTPLVRRAKVGCVVHDWRHLRRPDEFNRAQAMYRRTWAWSVRRSPAVICISQKTEQETLDIVPDAHTTVIPNGGDHPQRWKRVARGVGDTFRILTYGHHANKRPELVVRAAERMARERPTAVTVLGVGGERAKSLQGLIDLAQLTTRGYVDELEYQTLVQRSDCVALVSSDEGFGLPAVEARYFGIPFVCCSDSGLASIHPDAVVAEPTDEDVEVAFLSIAEQPRREGSVSAPHSWSSTATEVRAVLMADPGRRAR